MYEDHEVGSVLLLRLLLFAFSGTATHLDTFAALAVFEHIERHWGLDGFGRFEEVRVKGVETRQQLQTTSRLAVTAWARGMTVATTGTTRTQSESFFEFQTSEFCAATTQLSTTPHCFR